MPDKLGRGELGIAPQETADADARAERERARKFEEDAKADLVRSIVDFGLGYGDAQSIGPMNVKSSPEALDAVKDAVQRLADQGKFHKVYTLLRYVPARIEDVQIPALQQWAAERLVERYAEKNLDGVAQIAEIFHITPEAQQRYAREAVKLYLMRGDRNAAMQLRNKAGIGSEYITTPEAQDAARQGVLSLLKKGEVADAKELANSVGISRKDVQEDAANREAAWAYIYDILSDRGDTNLNDLSFDQALQIAKDFPQVDRPRTSEESEKLVAIFSRRIGDGRFDEAKALLRPTTQELQEAAKNALARRLRFGAVDDSIALMQTHSLPESTLHEPQVRDAAKEGFMRALANGKFDDAKTLEYFFGLSKFDVHRLALDAALGSLEGREYGGKSQNAVTLVHDFHLDVRLPTHAEKMHAAAMDAFLRSLADGDIRHAQVLQQTFGLSPEECKHVALDIFTRLLKSGSVKKCVDIKVAYGLPADIFAAPEMRTAAREGMERALFNGFMEDAYVLEDLCALSHDDVTGVATKAFIDCAAQESIKKMQDIYAMFHPDLRNVSVKDVQFKTLLHIIGDQTLAPLAEQDPWYDGVTAMLKVQARAAKAEHDPWLTDMVPLVTALQSFGVVDRGRTEDAAVLLDYVKMFGMTNLPKMAEAFVALKRGTEFGKMSAAMQEQLRAIIGKKVDRLEGEQIINELRRFRREMQSTLLADEIPEGIDTEIGTEIFAGLKGDTRWGRSDSPQSIVAAWRRTREQKPDVAKLPEGYREHPMRVPLVDRREKVEKPDEVKERKEKTEKILARGTKEKPSELGACVALLEGARAELGEKVDRKTWWEGKRQVLAATMAFDGAGMEQALQEREAQLKEKNNSPEKIAKILDGVRAGYTKKRAEAVAVQDALRGLEYPEGVDDTAFVAFLEKLSRLRRDTSVKQTLLALSLEHIRRIAPEWGTRLDGALKNPGGPITTEQVTGLHDVYMHYVNEHYLGGDDAHHTGHATFSPELADALTWAYGLQKNMDGHILAKTKAAIDALEKGDVTLSEESMTVTLVPTQGLLRIYAGDVGDACYTSQHASLAAGGVPDLHAVMFVTNRSTAQERLQGSVLFVETRTPKGENVLLVRANNPRENLIGQVDAASLVKATIDAAIATAKARGIRIVAVPLDAASASCSNRSAVAEYYQKQYAKAPKIALVNEGETNFNGYNNWDVNAGHPSVVVWRV